MQIELYLNRIPDLDTILNSSVYHKINTILLQSSQISTFPDKNKHLGVLIDYPYGLSNTGVREHEILYSIRSGAKYIDVPINPDLVQNEKLADIFQDIFACQAVCKSNNIVLRPILEYRLFDTDSILDICERLESNRIDSLILGTGSIVDDINDNITICSQIIKKTTISPIPSVTNLTLKNLQVLTSIGVKTIRFSSIQIIENICKYGV